MTNILSWVKRNWQLLLILVLVYLVFRGQVSPLRYSSLETPFSSSTVKEAAPQMTAPLVGRAPPAPEVKERLVIKNSWLSLLVKNVRQVQKEIIKKAEKVGGYLVDSQIESPEGIDSGTVTVRVPTKKLDEVLTFIKTKGVRVVSENLQGHDVTDEYVDIKARLETLNKTKAKFEEILNKAEKIPDLLEVQRELINLQGQIDSLKGQEQYLEKSAENAKITVYLASDELALPYTPAKPWKPEVIFKQAVRSLISTLRVLGTIVIWLAVYSIILIPSYFILRFLLKKDKKDL